MNQLSQKGLTHPDLSQYEKNRANFPPLELAKYAGQHVAFSTDGTHILACGETQEEMEQKLLALGVPPNQVVGSYIDSPDVDSIL